MTLTAAYCAVRLVVTAAATLITCVHYHQQHVGEVFIPEASRVLWGTGAILA